jgi:hypothetical protein
MTSIWYEILPVTLESDQIVMLRRREDGEAQSWLVAHQAGMHPNDAVLEQLELLFGDLFEPDASIVHSTSWRYCQRTERLILTYLVVLPQRTWRCGRVASDRIVAQRLGKVEQVHGDNLHPPGRIEVSNIHAHALDHLAWLNCYDESINVVLESGWLEVLETRLPKPAGYVARTCKQEPLVGAGLAQSEGDSPPRMDYKETAA